MNYSKVVLFSVLVFLKAKTMHKQATIPVMLELFLNISVALEQICVFKVSIIIELTILCIYLCSLCIYFICVYWSKQTCKL